MKILSAPAPLQPPPDPRACKPPASFCTMMCLIRFLLWRSLGSARSLALGHCQEPEDGYLLTPLHADGFFPPPAPSPRRLASSVPSFHPSTPPPTLPYALLPDPPRPRMPVLPPGTLSLPPVPHPHPPPIHRVIPLPRASPRRATAPPPALPPTPARVPPRRLVAVRTLNSPHHKYASMLPL